MKYVQFVVFAGLGLMAGITYAERDHDKWVNIDSVNMPILRSAQNAQGQIAKVGQTDTSSVAGKKASQLIAKGKELQNQILSAKGQPLSEQQLDTLKVLIMEMDQAAAGPAGGTQGACFKSCDDAYGKGFGGGKGWSRFWCKASCFKINVNVGGNKSKSGVGSLSGGATNTAQPAATVKAAPASGS
ncbi:MAG: hypothetical protein L0Z73_08750 [Gammaproteobacteria bacterium]|nr:hypothetical protein [Gammaproteobacteria bacterium]